MTLDDLQHAAAPGLTMAPPLPPKTANETTRR